MKIKIEESCSLQTFENNDTVAHDYSTPGLLNIF